MTKKIIHQVLLIAGLACASSPILSYDAELNAILFESSDLMQAGQVAEALLLLKEHEADYGESREYMNNLAVAYLGNSNPDIALSILRQLVDNDPLYSIIAHNLLEMELQITDAREDKIKPVLFIQTVESFFNRVTPTQETSPEVDVFTLAGALVDQWTDAWSSKDYDTYINQYSQRFTGPNGENFSAWSSVRKNRLNKPGAISILTSNMDVKPIGDTQLIITFDQQYSSSNYSDQVRKELVMVRENTDWKILRESTLAEY